MASFTCKVAEDCHDLAEQGAVVSCRRADGLQEAHQRWYPLGLPYGVPEAIRVIGKPSQTAQRRQADPWANKQTAPASGRALHEKPFDALAQKPQQKAAPSRSDGQLFWRGREG